MSSERGYTLVELIAVMAILGTVLATLTALFVSGTRSELDLADRVQAQNDGAVGLSRLRRDAHCATSATAVTPQAVTLAVPTACVPAGVVSWCARSVSANRFSLHRRASAGACSSSDPLLADFLRTDAVFAYESSTPALRAKLRARLELRTPKMATSYTLCDVLVLRNSAKPTTAGTLVAC